MNYNEILYNTTKKTIEDLGQDIGWNEKGQGTIEFAPTKTFKGLVKYKKQLVQNSNYYIELKDQYEFILLDKVCIDEYLVWNGSKYHVISLDNTIEGLYKCYGEFKTVMNTHIYSIIINNENPISMKVGDKVQLNCTCKDNDTIDIQPTITYKSSNSDIATISPTGLINGIKEGTVDITVTYNNVSSSIKCNVSKADEYSIQCDDISVDMGSSVQLSPICMKNGVQVESPTITYTSLDSSIASCDTDGLVNGVSSGATNINIEWQGVTKTINVTVNAVQANYTISGSVKLLKDKQTVYTINPSLPSNYSWELDEMSVDLEIAEIVNSNQSQCILTTTSGDGEPVTLNAKANGTIVASIDLTCLRK